MGGGRGQFSGTAILRYKSTVSDCCYVLTNIVIMCTVCVFNIIIFCTPHVPLLACFFSLLARYFNDLMDLFMRDTEDLLSPSQASFDLTSTIREEDDYQFTSPIQVKGIQYHKPR